MPNEIWKYRINAYRSNGSVVESRSVLEAEIEKTHNELMELDGVRHVETLDPSLWSRSE